MSAKKRWLKVKPEGQNEEDPTQGASPRLLAIFNKVLGPLLDSRSRRKSDHLRVHQNSPSVRVSCLSGREVKKEFLLEQLLVRRINRIVKGDVL